MLFQINNGFQKQPATFLRTSYFLHDYHRNKLSNGLWPDILGTSAACCGCLVRFRLIFVLGLALWLHGVRQPAAKAHREEADQRKTVCSSHVSLDP